MTEHVGPAAYYSTGIAEYDERTAEEELPQAFLDVRDRFTGMVEGDRVLDAGCGPGRDTDHFADQGYDALGIDLAPGAIEYAVEEGCGGEYAVMDIAELGLAEGAFDGVWCNDALFFVPPEEMGELVEELHRVQPDDGVAQFALKLGDGAVTREQDDADVAVEQYLVPEEDAVAMLEDAGYTVLDHQAADVGPYRFGNFFCRAD